ncbi:aldose 1-epimerase family protein [Ulvibacterium marinum]|uniref:Aldose 1-epimerase family protein n=1 Tax=Ulvibacterium marinum TaxID=2419782 RepID=A0A3B0BVE4_9FLAO|nr:aldose 1-epimerase family protein [Ulvibacterium marinum]RKN77012.1 aldose 1-epimerase family protein [Ulvibacterium marinum]
MPKQKQKGFKLPSLALFQYIVVVLFLVLGLGTSKNGTYLIKNKHLTVTVNAKGAELTSLKSTATGKEFLWQGDSRTWKDQAPILFPIVGKLKRDTYRIANKEHTLKPHGFAKDEFFKRIYWDTDSLVMRLTSNTRTLKAYPFQFELEIAYKLEDSKLKTYFNVKNKGKVKMPFSIGFHPGFRYLGEEGHAISELYFDFGSDKPLERYYLENGLQASKKTMLHLRNGRLYLSDSLFSNRALVFKHADIHTVLFGSRNPSEQILVDVCDAPYFALWSWPFKRSNFVCIEPWWGLPDSLDSSQNLFEKEGIELLRPKEQRSGMFSIKITTQ